MKTIGLFLIVLYSLTLSATVERVRSPFAACQGKLLLHPKEYKEQQKVWEESKQCGIDATIVPHTNFWETTFSKLGNEAETRAALNFLTQVGLQAQKNVEQNIVYSEILINCALRNQKWFEQKKDKKTYNFDLCDEMVASVRETIKVVRPHLRFNLALSTYKKITLTAEETKPEDNINSLLKEASGTLAPKTNPLTPEELDLAVKQYNKDTAEINKQWEKIAPSPSDLAYSIPSLDLMGYQADPNAPYNNFLMLKRRRLQLTYKAKYLEILAQIPIMGFLGSANPTNEEIAVATKELLKNSLNEKSRIDRLLTNDKYLATDPTKLHFRAKALIEFMKYGPVLNEFLTENDQYCGTATGLSEFVSKTQMKNNVLIVGSMIGTALFTSWYGPALLAGTAFQSMSAMALSTFAVLPISGMVYYHDYTQYVQSKERAFNAPENILGGKKLGTIDSYSKAKGVVVLNLALAAIGIDLWGSGIGKGLVSLTGAALTGKSLGQESTKLAFQSVLKEHGVKELKAQELVANLTSKDAKLVESSILTIMQTIKLSDKEVLLFKNVLTKFGRNFTAQEAKRLELFYYRLPIDPIKREKVISSSLEIIQGLSPERLAKSDRHEVLRAVIAISSYEKHNTEKMVQILNQWSPTQIDGLARTYELAGEKLLLSSAKPMNERTAFGQAVSELMDLNDEFRVLSKTEKNETKRLMISCGYAK